MLLAFDTSTAACTAALFDEEGTCLGSRNELIGRGHAERLVPMISELLDGRRADRILVGVGPGSFTGIRVAIAAAHGLAIGWEAELDGMSSLALLAAGANGDGEIGVALTGGHGELFVQQFDAATGVPTMTVASRSPITAAALVTAQLVIGSGARQLVDARGSGEARDAWPSAADALKIPQQLRTLAPKPLYGRAPDARVPEAA
ncbi:MAG TPA: tRNA (adenosine(37)-N6)-threonylcarbamoyltransferase complex dimerization subunit type 1 TsaB [Sphingomicrobium sp.]|nr:tRNA (adenosine(37)-N6)-threonylcarbamoyltransferase complex dimerization subunit type 1 TsaB [Sphingomicrobium sp.]